MSKHTFKVFNPATARWVNYATLSDSARREANHRGLVEHSEFCECVVVNDNPPF